MSLPTVPPEFRLAVRHADEFVRAMASLTHPTFCPLCLLKFLAEIRMSTVTWDALRKYSHPFWNACIVLVTTKRSDEDCAALNAQLGANVQICRDTAFHASREPASQVNPLPSCFGMLYGLLANTLNGGRRSMVLNDPRKAFNSKGILWPSHPRDLTPLGPAASAEAHVAWCCRLLPISSDPLFYLGCAICVAREEVLPYLLVTPVRERLLWCLVKLLDDPNGAGVAAFPWPQHADIQPVELTAFQMTHSLRYHDNANIMLFLLAMIHGGDSTLADVWRLTKGCGDALVLSLRAIRRRLANVPDSHRSAYLSVLDTFESRLASVEDQLSDVIASGSPDQSSRYMQEILFACYRRRQCHGPGCAEVPVAKAFARCKNCLFTHYCSRECQRADWKTGQTPHKLLCQILAAVTPAYSEGSHNCDVKEAYASAVTAASDESIEALIPWALAKVGQTEHQPHVDIDTNTVL